MAKSRNWKFESVSEKFAGWFNRREKSVRAALDRKEDGQRVPIGGN